jgi:hypothetical protein
MGKAGVSPDVGAVLAGGRRACVVLRARYAVAGSGQSRQSGLRRGRWSGAGDRGRELPYRAGRLARRTAARYRNATYVEIPESDHMVFYGDALSITMGHIDDWIARNNMLSTA